MKTYSEWRGRLSEYLSPGDRVDESMADYFLGVVFPATFSSTCIQMGEPYTHDADGYSLYMTLRRRGSSWVYTGIERKDGK